LATKTGIDGVVYPAKIDRAGVLRRRDTLCPYGVIQTEDSGGAHLPPTKVFRRLTGSMNKTMLKALLAASANRPTYASDFPDVKFRVAALK